MKALDRKLEELRMRQWEHLSEMEEARRREMIERLHKTQSRRKQRLE